MRNMYGFLVLVALAGCTTGTPPESGDGTASVNGSDGGPAVSVTPDATPDRTVALSNYEFAGADLTVPSGTVVRFRNIEGQHTVTVATSGVDRVLEAGEAVTVTFHEEGTYQVYCRFHGSPGSGMHTDVTVG